MKTGTAGIIGFSVSEDGVFSVQGLHVSQNGVPRRHREEWIPERILQGCLVLAHKTCFGRLPVTREFFCLSKKFQTLGYVSALLPDFSRQFRVWGATFFKVFHSGCTMGRLSHEAGIARTSVFWQGRGSRGWTVGFPEHPRA